MRDVIYASMKSPKLPGRLNSYVTHSIAWVLAFSLPFLVRLSNISPWPSFSWSDTDFGWLWLYFCKALIWIGVFYIKYYLVMPYCILQKKAGLFILIQLLTLCIICTLSYLLLCLFITGYHYNTQNLYNLIYFNSLPFAFVLAGCFIWQLYEQKIKADMIILDDEKRRLIRQIERMRTRLSPSFINNSIDTLLYLVRAKPGEFDDGIRQLLSVMEYTLADTETDKMPLVSEINNLKNYISFVALRHPNKIKLNISDDVLLGNQQVLHMALLQYAEEILNKPAYLKRVSEVEICLYKKSNLVNFIVYEKNAGRTYGGDGVQNVMVLQDGNKIVAKKLIINTYGGE
ncbi:MAG TPA: histidine kinase [Chitinophagaceae bacterium]|nr:histidine kinase [Chitinophagaceae bacterium]